MKTATPTLGQKLAAARLAKGITQQEAANRLGVSMMTLSRWERGYHSPDVPMLARLAKLYGTEFVIR